MADAVVLVGMSVREVDARDDLTRLVADVDGSIAFLQMGDPSLARELDRLADRAVERITLVGVSLGHLAPANSWLRRIAAHWWRERAGHRPVVDVSTQMLGALEEGELRDVLARTRVITGTEAALTSAAWEDVPRHRHQLLICRGPRCTALGSDESAVAVIIAMMQHDLGDDDVLLTHTGCQFPCNNAPVMSVQPDDVWYAGVTPEVAAQIVEEHLLHDRPLESHRLARERGPLERG